MSDELIIREEAARLLKAAGFDVDIFGMSYGDKSHDLSAFSAFSFLQEKPKTETVVQLNADELSQLARAAEKYSLIAICSDYSESRSVFARISPASDTSLLVSIWERALSERASETAILYNPRS